MAAGSCKLQAAKVHSAYLVSNALHTCGQLDADACRIVCHAELHEQQGEHQGDAVVPEDPQVPGSGEGKTKSKKDRRLELYKCWCVTCAVPCYLVITTLISSSCMHRLSCLQVWRLAIVSSKLGPAEGPGLACLDDVCGGRQPHLPGAQTVPPHHQPGWALILEAVVPAALDSQESGKQDAPCDRGLDCYFCGKVVTPICRSRASALLHGIDAFTHS